MFCIYFFKRLIRDITLYVKLIFFQYKWKKNNEENYTIPVSLFDSSLVKVGKKTYGKLNVISYNNPKEGLEIGSYVSIADQVIFLLGGEHHPSFLLNYPFKINTTGDRYFHDNTTKGVILISDDVWIGYGSTITSGVHIGKGAIIAAGSTITKDAPPYSIVTTNRIIKYRFDDELLDKLLKLDYSLLTDEFIEKNISLFYRPLDEKSLEEILALLESKNV